MPIYEFECKKCGSVFENLIIKSSDKPECPDCGSSRASRCMSRFASNNVAKSYHIDTGSSGSCGPSGGGFS